MASILDEINALDAQVPASAPTKSSSIMDEIKAIEAQTPTTAPTGNDAIPPNPFTGGVKPREVPDKPWYRKVLEYALDPVAKLDTGVSLIRNTVAPVVGLGAGLIKAATNPSTYGTPEGGAAVNKTMEDYTRLVAGQPYTKRGAEAMQTIGEYMTDNDKLGLLRGIGPNESAMISDAATLGRAAFDKAGVQLASRNAPANPIPVQAPPGATIAGAEKVAGKPNIKLVSTEPPAPVEIHQPSPVTELGPKLATPAEQADRAAILKRIGLEDARKSAIANDVKAASTDFQTSKLDNASGNMMRAKLDAERAALQAHAEGIVEGTGGSFGLDESSRIARGNTILAPIDSLKDKFDSEIKRLYTEAHASAGGVPIEAPRTHSIVADTSEFTGTIEGEQLLKGVKQRMLKLGMLDKDGAPLPATVKQAEQLRQYVGDQWTPRTSRLIGTLKNAIDDDSFSAAGENLYKESRAMRTARANTLDNPNGIAKILDSSGPGGINRAVPVEKIPDAIAGMPNEQFGHVIKTLKSAPEDLQPQAQAALSEIKAHFANKLAESGSGRVGQWGSRDVVKYLKDNGAKINQLFTPEELAKIKDLRDAGMILAKDQTYPGAAVQNYNLMQRGVMAGIRGGSAAAGSVTGGFLGGPVGAAGGAAAGDFAGSYLAQRFGDRAAIKATQNRMVNLSELMK